MNPVAFLTSLFEKKETAPVPGPEVVLERLRKLQAGYEGNPQKVGLTGALINGYQSFLETGETPHEAYFAMRSLFSLTNGESNDKISEALSEAYPPKPSRFGDAQEKAVRGMVENGVWTFSDKAPAEVVHDLMKFARETPATGRDTGVKMLFEDMKNGGDLVYQFAEQEVASCAGARWFFNNRQFQDIARRYLGCEPVIDSITMWWSIARPASAEQLAGAAQAYHFDLDRIKFFKVFMYVNDVTLENGAHFYVKGSHRGFNDPCFLRDGRFSDEQIATHYGDSVISLEGPAGTMFLEDTRGLHKGNPLQKGERLIFEICYTNSLFGAPFDRIELKDKADLAQKSESRLLEKFH